MPQRTNNLQQILSALLAQGLDENAYSACACLAAKGDSVLARHVVGCLYPEGPKANAESLFDMASCSKIMVPTILALMAIEDGSLTLSDTLARFFDVDDSHKDISIQELLCHTSGIMPHVILENYGKPPENVLDTIFSLPLLPRDGTVRYSCLGFIVLGKILEKIYGDRLDVLARKYIFSPLGMQSSSYRRISAQLPVRNIAASELDAVSGKLLIGVVHDENARFLDGVSANAGIFSNLDDCHRYANALIRDNNPLISKAMLQKATRNYSKGQDVYRGLGFHLAGTAQNFAGDLFDEKAFGHTGFTGTSILIEPVSQLIIILLSNRVCPSRENTKFLRLRRCIHNALYAAFSKEFT